MKSWRNLPPALLAMFAIKMVALVALVAYGLTHSPESYSVRVSLADSGLGLATSVLGVVGFRELARRTAGRVSLGFKITALGFGLTLANQIWWHLFQVVEPHWAFATISKLELWTYFTVKLVPLLGVIIAATVAERRAAVAGAIALLVADPLPWIAARMYGWLITSWKAQIALIDTLSAVALIALFAITSRLATAGARSPASAGTSGFRTIASGLWLRVIAACTVAGLSLLLVLGKADEGAIGILKLATISSAIAGAISLAMVARGALGAMVADLPAAPLVFAASASLWGLGVTLAQLPYTYRLLYGGDDHGFDYGGHAQDYAQALSIIAPLVAVAAIAAVARAISIFAARRGLEQLRFEAQGKGIGFVGLMLASVGVQQWLLPKAISEGSMTFMVLGAAVCSLWATVLMARLCALAADSLQAEPGLPTATVVG